MLIVKVTILHTIQQHCGIILYVYNSLYETGVILLTPVNKLSYHIIVYYLPHSLTNDISINKFLNV